MTEQTAMVFNYGTIWKETGRAELHNRILDLKVRAGFWPPETSDGRLTVTSIIRYPN